MNGQIREKLMLNTKEACSYLGIPRMKLDGLRKVGTIKSLRVGRTYLYPITELHSFVNRNLGKEITKDGLIIGEY